MKSCFAFARPEDRAAGRGDVGSVGSGVAVFSQAINSETGVKHERGRRGRRFGTLLIKCCQEIGGSGSKAGLHGSLHVLECSRKAVGTELDIG